MALFFIWLFPIGSGVLGSVVQFQLRCICNGYRLYRRKENEEPRRQAAGVFILNSSYEEAFEVPPKAHLVDAEVWAIEICVKNRCALLFMTSYMKTDLSDQLKK